MEKPLSIRAQDVQLSDRDEARIRRRAEELEKFYPRLVGCSVAVEGPGGPRNGDRGFRVALDLRVPGADPLIVNRRRCERLDLAIGDAFDVATRRLDEFGRVQRGETRSARPSGRG